ncbi:hypothetical protein AN403_2971 [Pseudomonas fluorescens]|jgi:arylsulfatase|uniref:Uncharacterized protein n=1 Tax=Pseudomonas fluorescens TaxID=294 RepID=A0A0P8X166_PSEFL|nr:hypothetical protein [Pseudomonas fluorescens]KPU59448.1 hypothetical protein AN403_2971 [Pseudomonas fluorescens]
MRSQAGFGDNAKTLQWQLFDMTKDRGETTDLATSQPQTVQRLKEAWLKYADEVGVAFAAH